ncbi:hypothetical protein ACLB2K_069025 [Fragaria x ananassa]
MDDIQQNMEKLTMTSKDVERKVFTTIKKKQEKRQKQTMKKAEKNSGLKKSDSTVSHDATETLSTEGVASKKDITTSYIESKFVASAPQPLPSSPTYSTHSGDQQVNVRG